MSRLVVIGGVAAGMSAASQAKRRQPDLEVVVLEKGTDVSYGACGMPYNIEDPSRDIQDLVVITAERFRKERGLDVRLKSPARAIDTKAKTVTVEDLEKGETYELSYDTLVIATGARAVRPPIPGIDLPGVLPLRELTDGGAIKRFLDERQPGRVAIVGAGYIGMEMAEVFRTLGLEVTILERLGQVIPGWEPVVAEVALETLHRHGVEVHTGVAVEEIVRAEGGGLTVRHAGGETSADLVLVSAGVKPNSEIAGEAGIDLGDTGAIKVDPFLLTSAPDVYAAGDCAEAYHRLTGRGAYVPLGTTANKQGKIAGANAAGAKERFGGILGTAGFKLFELEVARTGLGTSEIEALGLEAVQAVSRHASRAHGYPNPSRITTVLFAELGTGRLLGAQMIGGDAVAKRVDVFATAIQAGMTLEDVEQLDLSYAPPFAPVWDPILIAAQVARKTLAKAAKEKADKDKGAA